jgi:hypothetical protein
VTLYTFLACILCTSFINGRGSPFRFIGLLGQFYPLTKKNSNKELTVWVCALRAVEGHRGRRASCAQSKPVSIVLWRNHLQRFALESATVVFVRAARSAALTKTTRF